MCREHAKFSISRWFSAYPPFAVSFSNSMSLAKINVHVFLKGKLQLEVEGGGGGGVGGGGFSCFFANNNRHSGIKSVVSAWQVSTSFQSWSYYQSSAACLSKLKDQRKTTVKLPLKRVCYSVLNTFRF